ncbi:hypothetical protein CR513_41140, partial [Mucuna pruriens]
EEFDSRTNPFEEGENDRDPTNRVKDNLCDIGGPITRPKTQIMKQSLYRNKTMKILGCEGGHAYMSWLSDKEKSFLSDMIKNIMKFISILVTLNIMRG